MIGYVDTLGRSIDKRGRRPGADHRRSAAPGEPGDGFTIELGTYEDVRNLFGAIARDVEAQAALGVVLGAYMNTVMADASALTSAARTGVDHVAQFADLLGDAVTAEQAEMIATAASADGAERGTGRARSGSPRAALAVGAGPGRSSASSQARSSRSVVRADRRGRAATDAERSAASRRLRRDHRGHRDARPHRPGAPAHPRPATTTTSSLRQVDAHLARLAELDAAGDAEAYRDEVSDMVDFIEQRAPQLDVFVTEVRSIPAVNELRRRSPLRVGSTPRTRGPAHGNLSPCRSGWSDSDVWAPTWCAGFTPVVTSAWCTT